MAKATSNTTYPSNENTLSQGPAAKLPSLGNSFLVHFQEFSPNLHIFRVKDYTHDLLCEMTLEVKELLVPFAEESEEEACLSRAVSCGFSNFNLQNMSEKTGLDVYLQDLLIGQFQLKILEQLLLFCEQENATNLILMVSDPDLDSVQIYSRFFASEKRVETEKGEMTEIVIPTHGGTYDSIIDFMEKIDREFRCALWRGQSINPAFRAYLKSNACL
jgi:hypothetical protein